MLGIVILSYRAYKIFPQKLLAIITQKLLLMYAIA
jgi:hypothetical protein